MHYALVFWRKVPHQRLIALIYYSSHRSEVRKNERERVLVEKTSYTENTDDELRISTKDLWMFFWEAKPICDTINGVRDMKHADLWTFLTALSSWRYWLLGVNCNQLQKSSTLLFKNTVYEGLRNSHRGSGGEGLLAILFSPPLLSNLSHNDKVLEQSLEGKSPWLNLPQ